MEDEAFETTTTPQGPITDAYLNRDIHPDEIPGTKGSHATQFGSAEFPHKEEPLPPAEDIWMYH